MKTLILIGLCLIGVGCSCGESRQTRLADAQAYNYGWPDQN